MFVVAQAAPIAKQQYRQGLNIIASDVDGHDAVKSHSLPHIGFNAHHARWRCTCDHMDPALMPERGSFSSTPPGASMRTRKLARMPLCVQVGECVCINAHAYAGMCTSMRVCIRACTWIRLCACLCAHGHARARAGVCAAARVLCLVGTKGMHGLPQCNAPLGANSLNSIKKMCTRHRQSAGNEFKDTCILCTRRPRALASRQACKRKGKR